MLLVARRDSLYTVREHRPVVTRRPPPEGRIGKRGAIPLRSRHCDRETARKKYHLTAREAGELAKKADVKQLTLFHFSPRYSHQEAELKLEALEAFQ